MRQPKSLLLFLSFFWSFSGLGESRQLTQAPSRAPAPGPAASTGYESRLLAALTGNASASGPILFKTFEAAYFALLAEAGREDQELADDSMLVPFGNSSNALVAWDSRDFSLILAFATSAADNSSLTRRADNLAPVQYLSSFFGGTPPQANPVAVAYFNSIVDNATATDGAIAEVTGGGGNASVGRVLCTGHGGGGALAQLCGPWAQISYPRAQVRVITFGAPRVADRKFDWAIEQLVDLPYLWLTDPDNKTVGQIPVGPVVLPNTTRVIPVVNRTAEGQPGSIQYYSTLLNNTLKANGSDIPVTITTNFSYGYLPGGKSSQFVASAAPAGGGFFSTIGAAIGSVTDTISAAGSVISNLLGNLFSPSSSTSPAPAPGPSDFSLLAPSASTGSPLNTQGGVASTAAQNSSASCPPVLCKIKPAITQACAAYGNGATLGPGSVTVTANQTSTNVAVAWNADSRVATFSWRGTQETEDWIQNLKLQFSDDTSSAYFTELYTGTRIYEGELNQFRAVTDLSMASNMNIRAQLDLMSNGAVPARVDCIGHSLGAGLSTICGPWAAEQWPSADVRVVNFGSPKAGNLQFAESVAATVGRVYRVVHALDAVPSLPPFGAYLHVNFALWLNGTTLSLDERPPRGIDALSWKDHGCDDQYAPGIRAASNVTIPAWVKALP